MNARRPLLFRITLGSLMCAAIMAPAGGQAQDGAASVEVVPASASVSSSKDEVQVDIVARNVENLGGFEVILSFDGSLLSPLDIVKGDFLGASNREVLCPDPTIEPTAVRLRCVTLRELPAGVDGEGTIAIVTFEPKDSGTSDLYLSKAELLHPDGSAIESTTQDSQLEVEGGGVSSTWLAVGIGAPVALVLAVAAVIFVRWRSQRRTDLEPDRGAYPE